MKNATINQKANDVMNEVTARYLEDICQLFSHNVNIDDTDWQTVYDLKQVAIEKLEELGLVLKYQD